MILKMTKEEYERKYGEQPMTFQTPQSEPKTFGQKLGNAARGITNFFGATPIAETFGTAIARFGKTEQEKQDIQYPTQRQVLGSAVQSGANLIPGLGVGAKLATKVGVGAATGYAFDVGSKLQRQDKTTGQALTPGIGTAVGAGLPIANAFVVKPATKILGRLFKGLGSGVGGVPTRQLDEIIKNPKVAKQASDKLTKSGNYAIVEKNAKTMVEGVSKIRKEASTAFGKGLEQLSKADIDPKAYKAGIKNFLDKYRSQYSSGKRTIANVEFDDPKMLAKASDLINKINKSTFNLNGKSLRNLANEVENSAFKTTGNDAQRLSFNVFVDELQDVIKSAVNLSTGDKLKGINAAYSQDQQLAEAVEQVFGKVNFKNLPEVLKASQKLESLFTQKGIAPEVIDDFLNRIGESPSTFRAEEAVRQLINKEPRGLNTPGMTVGEITQAITGSLISPKTVANLSIVTGMAKEKLIPFLRALSPTARNVVIQALLKNQATQTPDQSQPKQ